MLIILLGKMSSIAQDSLISTTFLGVKSFYGHLIPHSKKIRHLVGTNPYGMEFDLGWILNSSEDWKRCNCYSRAGFSASQISLDRPEILGWATNLMMFAEPYLSHGNDLWFSVRMGVGPSWVSKVFDEDSNPENLLFSNHLSFIIHLDVIMNIAFGDHLNGKVFGKYNHISNGGVDQPNLGMNFTSMGLGLDYVFGKPEFPVRDPEPVKNRNVVFSVAAFGGMKNVVEGTSKIKKRTLGYGLMLKGRRKITVLNALNLGIEGYRDGEIEEKWQGRKDPRQLSGITGHDLIFGRFIFSQYWGTYLFAPYYRKHFFQRYSLTYNLLGDLSLGVNMKAHAEVAQNFSLHLSYDLN